jgi:hypothetical protein
MQKNFKSKDMKNGLIIFCFLAGLATILASCRPDRMKRDKDLAANVQQVIADEVIQTSRYTYVHVVDDVKEYWIAINKSEIELDKTYYWSVGAEMKSFTSKELDRTFPSIIFVSDFTDQPITKETAPTVNPLPMGETTAGKPSMEEQEGISVTKAEGGVTVAEIFAKKKSLDGKQVRIRGKVVKFSPMIMNRNWVHIQDGTRDGENFDLTITTQDVVSVGDVVTFEGILGLNRDFGAGYFYEVILENGKLKQ